MTHRHRVERHIIVDILAGACGTSAAAAFLQRSWLALALALALGVVLYLLERETIEEEDSENPEDTMRIPDLLVEALKKVASRPHAEIIFPEYKDIYEQGLSDGAAQMAQYVLDEMKEEKKNA